MTVVLGLAVLLGIGSAAHARAVEPAYGRVRFADHGGTILRAAGEGSESDRATVNAPLFPGDLLRTDSAQRVEVQLAGGSMILVDSETDVVFQSLPNPTAMIQDSAILALKSGVIRITSRVADHEVFRVDTAEAAVYLNGEAEIRVDAIPREGTRVTSLRGVAEVVGSDSPVLVRGGMSMVLSGPTGASADWRSYHRPGDDTWVYEPYGWAPYDYCGWPYTGNRVPWGYWPSPYVGYHGNYYDPLCSALIQSKRLQSPHVTPYGFPTDQASHDARRATDESRASSADSRRAAHTYIQDQLMKRGSRGSEIVPNPRVARPPAAVEPRATAPRQGRPVEASRRNDANVARPAQPRIDVSRRESSRQQVHPGQAPQAQAPRAQPQQSQPQRLQHGWGGSGSLKSGGNR